MRTNIKQFRLSVMAAALALALPCAVGATVVVGSDIEINGSDANVGTPMEGYGNVVSGSDPVNVGQDGDTVVIVNSENSGIVGYDSTSQVNVLGRTISIGSTKEGSAALWLQYGAAASVGNDKTESVTLTGTDTGIVAIAQTGGGQGAKVNIRAKELKIVSDNIGILTQSNQSDPDGLDDGATSSVVIDAGNTSITSHTGIAALSNSRVEISGNLTVDAQDRAIETRGYSNVIINEDGKGTVVLNGDIAFASPSPDEASGDVIDSTVKINLNGEGSSWTGNVLKSYKPENSGQTIDNGLDLKLAGGAQWNVTRPGSVPAEYQGEQVAVGHLTMDGGVINLDDTSATAQVKNISGSGTVNATVEGSSKTGFRTGSVEIADANGDVNLNVNYEGITADDVDVGKGDNATLAKQVIKTGGEGANGKGSSGKVTSTQTIGEGAVAGAITQTVTYDLNQADGEDAELTISGVSEARNTGTDALQKIAAMNFLTFRSQMNDVSKRMGDLRTMPQSDGMWARAIAGQSEYKSIHNTYQTLQIGADRRMGNMYLGATASYTNGDGKLGNGKTDDKNFGLGIYGGWLNNDGQYIDVIVKRHKFDSDYDIRYMGGQTGKGSMDTWGTSASVEYGWRQGIEGTAYYIEPQAEIMVGHLNGVGYTNRTSEGNVRVRQDGIDSLVGRLGVAMGWVSPDRQSSTYIKASVLHDWEGDAETRVSKDGISRKVKEEMGGTWGEFALGGTWNLNRNVAAYGEIETTAGNPVRTTYQVSGGIRYSFW